MEAPHPKPLNFYIPLHKRDWAGRSDLRMTIAYIVPNEDAYMLLKEEIRTMARSIYNSTRRYSVALNEEYLNYSGFVNHRESEPECYVFDGPLEPLIAFIRTQLAPKVPRGWSLSNSRPRPFVEFGDSDKIRGSFTEVEGLLVKSFDFSTLRYKFRSGMQAWSFDVDTVPFAVTRLPPPLPSRPARQGSYGTKPRGATRSRK